MIRVGSCNCRNDRNHSGAPWSCAREQIHLRHCSMFTNDNVGGGGDCVHSDTNFGIGYMFIENSFSELSSKKQIKTNKSFSLP